MIISQIDAQFVSPENLIKDFQKELGYSFEIKSSESIETEATAISKKVLKEVSAEILEEVRIAICYTCEKKSITKKAESALEAKSIYLDAKQAEAVQAKNIFLKPVKGEVVEAKSIYLSAVKDKVIEAKVISGVEAVKLPAKYFMLKKMHARLNNFIDKLNLKYERLNDKNSDGIKNLKPLKIINKLLDRINIVQEHFINKLEEIEKSTGRDITLFDGALEKIEGLEEQLNKMQKEILSTLRRSKMIIKAPKPHIIKMNGDGLIGCGF